jgi:aspartate carbamoyltransferase regulatory subunit
MTEIEEAQAALEAAKFTDEGTITCQNTRCGKESPLEAFRFQYHRTKGRVGRCCFCGAVHYRTTWVRRND